MGMLSRSDDWIRATSKVPSMKMGDVDREYQRLQALPGSENRYNHEIMEEAIHRVCGPEKAKEDHADLMSRMADEYEQAMEGERIIDSL